MIHLYLDLLCEVYNAINQHFHKKIHFLSFFFLDFLDIFLKNEESKSFSMILSVSLLMKISVITGIIHSASFFRIFRRRKINCHC